MSGKVLCMADDDDKEITRPGAEALDHLAATIDSLEIDSEALRAAEFMQAQMILDTMVGQTIEHAEIEETRIAITLSDGNTYFFYGFMGGSGN